MIETVSLALAYDHTKILCQFDGHCHIAMLGLEVGDALRICVGAVLGPLQYQPGRPVRGQGVLAALLRPTGASGPAAARVAVPLGVAQPLRVARHGRVAPRIAVALEVPKQP